MSVAPTLQVCICHVISTDFGKLQSVMGWPPKAKFLITSNGTHITYRHVSFCTSVMFLKNIAQIEHRISI